MRVELEIGRLQDEEDKRAARTARIQNIRYAKQLQRQHRLALKRQSQAVQDGLEHDLRSEIIASKPCSVQVALGTCWGESYVRVFSPPFDSDVTCGASDDHCRVLEDLAEAESLEKAKTTRR